MKKFLTFLELVAVLALMVIVAVLWIRDIALSTYNDARNQIDTFNGEVAALDIIPERSAMIRFIDKELGIVCYSDGDGGLFCLQIEKEYITK